MSEMMLIPKADLVAGYNAIRAKGVAGQIKSGQLADKINSIPSGGGGNLPSVFNPGDFPIQSNWVLSRTPDNTVGKLFIGSHIVIKKGGTYRVRAIIGSLGPDTRDSPSTVQFYLVSNSENKPIGTPVKPTSSHFVDKFVIEQDLELPDPDPSKNWQIAVGMTPGQTGTYPIEQNDIVCRVLELCIDWNPFA